MAAGVDVCATKPNMKRRTPWHDYRRQGTYMLTFVIEGPQASRSKPVRRDACCR